MYRHTLSTILLFLGLAVAPALAEVDLPLINDIDHKVVTAPLKSKMVQATYLGVTGDRVSPALNSQLNLPKGLGLVITHVAADSPAEAAGLKKHDVLHKLDDQLLVNFEQFAVLVRLHEPGDTVTLSVIRGGQPAEVTATLSEHELPELSHHQGMMPGPGTFGGHNFSVPYGAGMPMIDVKKLQEDITKAIPKQYIKHIVSGELYPIQQDGKYKLRVADSDHVIHIYSDGKAGKQVKVEDAQGNLLFDGPWEAPMDPVSSGLPEKVIQKVQSIFDTPDFGEPIQLQDEEIEMFRPRPAQEANDGA